MHGVDRLRMRISRRGLLMNVGKGLMALGATGLAEFIFAACGGTTSLPALAQSSRKTDSVVIGMWQELEFLNVLYTQGGGALSAAKLAQRGLLFLDKDSNWIGELATEVPSLKNGGISSDGLTITFKLRKGVTWHDGPPVTSADVKATWEMIMDPSHAVISRYGYDKIDSIATPDDQTVALKFKEVFASWPILFDAIIPKHVIDANKNNLDKSAAMQQPVGFGPYKIISAPLHQGVTYEAFDKYWNGAPKIKHLFIKIYPSVDALMQAVTVGEVDLAWAMPASYIPQIKSLQGQGVALVTTPAANSERYVMNADAKLAPIFADNQLRHALHYAVNKQTIIDKLLYDVSKPGTSEWDGSPWQDPNLPKNEYDPAKAKEILDSLGWKPGSDGIRVKGGQRLTFTNSTTTGDQLRENVQLFVQQMFKDVGVEMTIKNAPTTELFGTWSQGGWWAHGKYQMGGWSHGLRVPDPDVSNRYLCSEIPSNSNPAGAQWYHYCNPKVDQLLRQQAQELDPAKRKQIIFNIQEILQADGYWIYLYTVPQIYTAPAALKNFVLHPFANFYWNPQDWEWA